MRYPYIWAFGRMRRQRRSIIEEMVKTAEELHAPDDAVWHNILPGTGWTTFNDIVNHKARERLQQLRDELQDGTK